MDRKEKIVYFIVIFMASTVGTVIGYTIQHVVFGHNGHLCECEYCKTVRQHEALEVLDSVIHDRIVINFDKEN